MTRSRLLCLGWSCADLSPMQTRCRRDLRGLGTRLRVLAAEFAQLSRPQCALILKALLLTLRPAKLSGRDAEHLTEMTRQMALIGKAHGVSNL
jgi:hypothetical protein